MAEHDTDQPTPPSDPTEPTEPRRPNTDEPTAEADADSEPTAEADADSEPTAEADAKPEQSVSVEDIGPALKRLAIEVPESRIKAKIEEAYQHLQTEAQLPGFRKGRAPRRLIERRFGSSIRDDVKAQLLSESYSQAMEDHGLEVLGEPDVKDVEEIELPESGPLSFQVEVEVAPSVELPPFDRLRVTRPSSAVSESDVEQELERLRERFGEVARVDDTQLTVEPGDFVMADVHVYAGEVVVEAADEAEVIAHHPRSPIMVADESRDYRGHVAGIIVDDLGKRLAGKQVGDVERITMTGPSGHEDERIRDQPITITLTIEEVERIEPAPVEKILEQMGMESEEDLRQRIRQMLEQRVQREQQDKMHEQVSEQLAGQVDLELPEGVTSRQTERLLARRRMELYYQGKSEPEIEQDIAEMRSGSEEEARKQLKHYFILDQAARDLDVDVSEQQLNGQIAMLAMQQGRRPEKLRQEMQQRGELEQMYQQIRERKTLDKILEMAQIVDEEADTEPGESGGAGESAGAGESEESAGPKQSPEDDDAGETQTT